MDIKIKWCTSRESNSQFALNFFDHNATTKILEKIDVI